MSAPQQTAPAQPKSLGGTLGKTPVPRLLSSASAARVTGTLTLTSPSETVAVRLVKGLVTKVKTSAPVAYLGSILYELGYIESDELNDSLRELARTKWLHGEILLTRAVISPAQVAEGLHEQTTRKLVHLFSLPTATTYAFEADVDHLASYGGTDSPSVDPILAVWRGVRDGLAAGDVTDALSRVKENAFRLASGADCKRYDLADGELTAIECLRARALTEAELIDRAGLEAVRARALLYFLLVTKRVEPTENSGVQRAYRPGTPSSAATPAVRPNLRPTVPEMAAVTTNPRISIASPATESGRWRAVAPPPTVPPSRSAPPAASSHPASRPPPGSARPATHAPAVRTPPIAAPAPPAESGTMRIADREASSPPPTARGASAPPPSRRPGLTPPQAWSAPSPSPSPRKSGAPPKPSLTPHPSTNSLNAKVIAELASRRQSIFERARAILKEDYFQRLSLARDASTDQVDLAFQALRTLWDPALLPPALGEAKDDAAFVMSCLNEAHATLRDPASRSAYASQLTMAALRAPNEQIEEDLAASGVTDLFEGAKIHFARGELDRAERLAKKAQRATPEAAGPLALLAWIEATRPQNTNVEETRKRIAMLDRALRTDPAMVEGFHWRGLLHKRIENHSAAMRDFRRVIELAPKHMEAVRELRVYEMRIRRNSISMKAVK